MKRAGERFSLMAAGAILLLTAARAAAQVPGAINYQGRLVMGGALVNSNNMSLGVSVYTAPAGGTLLYQENDTVTVADGLFATAIGDNSNGVGTQPTLTAALTAAGANAWLGIRVAGGAELTPRERILSAPYALVAPGGVTAEQDPVWTNARATGFSVIAPVGALDQPLEVAGDVEIGGGGGGREDFDAEVLAIHGRNQRWVLGVQNEAAIADSDFFIGKGWIEDGTFHIEQDGDVGIGTPAPEGKLEVSGAKACIRIDNTSETESGLIIADSAAHSSQFAALLYDAASASSLNIYVNDTNAPIMKASVGGLYVYQDAYIGNGAQGDGDAEFVQFSGQSQTWCAGVLNAAAAADSDFFVGTGTAVAARRLTVQPDGDVSIGTTPPAARLHVRSGNVSGVTDALLVENGDGGDLFAVEDEGHVGIGTSAPGAFLQVDGVTGAEILRVRVNASTKLLVADNGGTSLGSYNVAPPASGLYVSGEVLVGATEGATGYKMSVNGKIACEEVLVEDSASWPDYVFAPGYPLMPLDELETAIARDGRLPGVAPAVEIERSGISLGATQKLMMEKIEELTLYVIRQNKQIAQQAAEIERLRARFDASGDGAR
jgi:hypothetical protein